MEEIWKDIKGYEGYLISSRGNVFSKYSNRILKPIKRHLNHLMICLFKDGISYNFFIHRLVAEAFIPNPDNLSCVNHKDENPLNNNVDNLEWCSYQYNNTYGTRIERAKIKLTNGKKSKLVLQYDMNGNIIKEWPSSREIERELGISHKNISFCCSGKYKQAGGYIWRYK